MTRKLAVVLSWGPSALLLLVMAMAWRLPPIGSEPIDFGSAWHATSRDSSDDALVIVNRDPFRIGHDASQEGYEDESQRGAATLPARIADIHVASPPIAFRGVLTGPDGNVGIIDGVVGQRAGLVVHAGDTLAGGYRILAITRDSIVIRSSGGVWRVPLELTWR